MKHTGSSRFFHLALLLTVLFPVSAKATDAVSALGTAETAPASPDAPSAGTILGAGSAQPIMPIVPAQEDNTQTPPPVAGAAGLGIAPSPVADATISPIAETTAPPLAPANTPAAPAVAGLDAPVAPVSEQNLTPLPEEASGALSGTNIMGDSGIAQRHSGTYYDSEALVPDSELSAAGVTGPRKVDPAYEPGQKYIIVEKGPGASSTESQYIAATRALKLGRYAAAMEMFEKLYKRNHKDPRILMGLAVAQQGAGFNESAARTYEDLLKLQPNNPDAIVNLMGIMRTQYPSVTLKKLMELRGKYPSNPGIPAQLALVNAEMKNYDDALRYFEVAASMDPRNPSHVYNMAIVADQKGDVSNAIKFYERALQMDASYGDAANGLPREKIYDRLVVLRRKV